MSACAYFSQSVCFWQLSLEPVAGQVGHSLDAWALLRSEGDPRKMKHELSCSIMRLGPRHVLSFSSGLHRVALGCFGLLRAALGCLRLFRIALGCFGLRCLVGVLVASVVGWLIGWLVGWLVSWLVGWLVDWLAAWLDGCLVGWLIGWRLFDWSVG